MLIFMLNSSITKKKNNGPCLKPMFTWNSFDKPDTNTLPLVFSYIASTILTSDSGAPIHLAVVITIFLGTVSKSFCKSTKPYVLASPISSRLVALVRISHQWSIVLFRSLAVPRLILVKLSHATSCPESSLAIS